MDKTKSPNFNLPINIMQLVIGRPTKKLHDSFTVHFEAKNSYSVPTYFFL